MIPISQRLRARLEPIGDGSGKWRPDGLCQEAADTIDALVAVLEQARTALAESYDVLFYPANGESKQDSAIVTIDAALAKAKGSHE